MDILDQMLSELLLPPPARRVYINLVEFGEASARTIAERLSVARPSIYDHLAPLITLGLVIERDREGKTLFAVHDVNDLGRLLAERGERLDKLQRVFESERTKLAKRTHSVEPKIKFVEGKEGVLSILRDMLWEAGGGIKTVWPYHEMLRVLGKENLEEFNRKRIRHKIKIRSIWTNKVKISEKIWRGGEWEVERRFAPKGFAPEMGYSIYGNKVSFISSGKELYGFIVHSEDFADLMNAQFELLWKDSKI